MHGSLLHGFKQFVIARHGNDFWNDIVRATGAGGWYGAIHSYPDKEFDSLVRAAASSLTVPVADVLESFGMELVPILVKLYGPLIDPGWRTADLLVNSEKIVHKTVRLRTPDSDPPFLQPQQLSPDEVHIGYNSKRRLCAMAVGICKGVAAHYGETVDVTQPECTERGDPACRLVVRIQAHPTT